MADKRVGRPRIVDKELRIGVSERIMELIDEMCRERGITVSELIRVCVYETWQAGKDREIERQEREAKAMEDKVKAMTDFRLTKYGK